MVVNTNVVFRYRELTVIYMHTYIHTYIHIYTNNDHYLCVCLKQGCGGGRLRSRRCSSASPSD